LCSRAAGGGGTVNNEGPPAEVLAFIEQNIESIEQLEVLLFLHGQERALTTAEIFHEIQSSQASVNIRLKQLEAAGLINHEAIGQYRINRADQPLQKTLEELSRCYRTMRVRIIEAIYARRSDAVRTFAEAFKLKKKE
jgi:predicted transcriptional regulator